MTKETHLLFTSTGNNYVLSTSKPFSVGMVWRVRSEQELSLKMEEFRNNGKTVCQVEGYNIFVMWDGTLLSEPFMLTEWKLEQTELMAAYYLRHIQAKPRAYTRYEIKQHTPLFTHNEIPVL
jgi:hypothetical protein